MSPDAEIASRIYELQVLSTTGWGLALIIAFCCRWLAKKLEHGCNHCSHCSAERARRKVEEEDRARKLEESYGIRKIEKDMARPSSKPSDGEERDEGPEGD